MALARMPTKGSLVEGFLREHQRATARDVAYGLQLSVADASLQLHRLERAGCVVAIERVRVEHAKRPVAVYAPSEPFQRSAIFSDDWLR
jgi:DNA-binding MarR family transcriptional regulator